MNFKSMVVVASAVAAGVSMAASYESGVKLCQIELPNATTDAVITVPVVGLAEDAVNPANLVMTDGMSNGDYMYANVGGNRKAWVYNDTAWTGAAIAATDNVAGAALPAAGKSDTVNRGDSIWLHRQSTSSPIYLWGKVGTSACTVAAAAGYKMIGNPSTTAYSLLTIPWGVKPSVGDQVLLIDGSKATGVGARYTCSATGDTVEWQSESVVEGKLVTTTLTTETAPTIEAGQGFYYKATGTTLPTIIIPVAN